MKEYQRRVIAVALLVICLLAGMLALMPRSVAADTPPPDLCDLIVEDITWSPQNPSVGDYVTFAITIRNQGGSRSGFCNVELYIDGNSRGREGVLSIEAGDMAVSTYSWPAQAGSFSVKAVVDVLNQTKESDETNNEKTTDYATAMADLIIEDITWSPNMPPWGSMIDITITLRNQGAGDAGRSRVVCYVDSEELEPAYIDEIFADTVSSVTVRTPTNWGSHTIRAIADGDNIIVESDEANNEKTVPLPVFDLYLDIEGITCSPPNPLIGHGATFTASIKNLGNNWDDYFTVYFYVDDYLERRVYVDGIGGGAKKTAHYTWIAEAGTHVIKAMARVEGSAYGSDEAVNTMTVTPLPGRPDIVIQDIAWSLPDPSRTKVTCNVTLCNQGGVAADGCSLFLYVDDLIEEQQTVREITSGATVTQTFTWEAEPGSYVVKAVADEEGLLLEDDESNNEKMVSVTVVSPILPPDEPADVPEDGTPPPEADDHPDQGSPSKLPQASAAAAPLNSQSQLLTTMWPFMLAIIVVVAVAVLFLMSRRKARPVRVRKPTRQK